VLSQDFREFIQSLNANDVRYLIIGGYAVALHGHPRYTKDLDVWVDVTEENATRLIAALRQFGFGSLDLKPDDFLASGQVIQLGYPPNRIDLVTSADGVEFADCYATRVTVDLDNVSVHFISLDGLKRNKKASGRSQDLADLDALD